MLAGSSFALVLCNAMPGCCFALVSPWLLGPPFARLRVFCCFRSFLCFTPALVLFVSPLLPGACLRLSPSNCELLPLPGRVSLWLGLALLLSPAAVFAAAFLALATSICGFGYLSPAASAACAWHSYPLDPIVVCAFLYKYAHCVNPHATFVSLCLPACSRCVAHELPAAIIQNLCCLLACFAS